LKLPRDISAAKLIKLLNNLGFVITRQKGSHIRLTIRLESGSYHHVTIPNHDPIKIGTLNNIINVLAAILETEKETIIEKFKDL